MAYDTRDQEMIWKHQAEREKHKRAENKARGPIIAAFKCPVCGSQVVAHGFKWMCTRPLCCFAIGRAYKTDPHGHYTAHERQLETAYKTERENYLATLKEAS